jgi:Ser/Thr protein kinase RdoA (MazF antagonist)
MPEDKDFKRLVRKRMAKTGEAYTSARSRLRPPAATDLAALTVRTSLDLLAGHLESTYRIGVTKTAELDVGVFRIDRSEGPSWIARVFPSARSMTHVEDDARVLRFLEAQGLPVERLADDSAVSTLDRQGVLVTQRVVGPNARHDATGPTMLALGATLGRLHALDVDRSPVIRSAGGWHHILPNGGGLRDAASNVVRELVSDSSDEARFMRAQLEAVSDFADLPHALIHPDPCGANAIVSSDGTPVLVDWTGAGIGPRILSLAGLLAGSVHPVPAAPPLRVLEPIDAIMAGYRSKIALTAAELDALPHAIVASWTVLACWMHLVQDMPAREVARGIADQINLADRVSQRVRQTYDLDDDNLTRWFRPPDVVIDPEQGSLF